MHVFQHDQLLAKSSANMFKGVVIIFVTCFAAHICAFNIQPKIANGFSSKQTQFPYYVLLEISYPESSGICGSTLINKEFVVTAAHCLRSASKIVARLGLWKRLNVNSENGQQMQVVDMKNVFIYPYYSSFFVWNDIALIKLKPVKFTATVQPINMPDSCESNENTDVIIIGFGFLDQSKKYSPETLQWAPTKTIDFEDCKPHFTFVSFRNSVIFTKSLERRNVCGGDSGGPLVRKHDNVLIGISSFGHSGRSESDHPQVHTKITSYLKWISKKTGMALSRC